MNKRLYILAGTILALTLASSAGVIYLQGGSFQSTTAEQSTDSDQTIISLGNDTATADSNKVSIDGSSVSISAGGTYEIQGESASVTIAVLAEVADDVTIILNNSRFMSLDLQSTGTNVVTLADSSSNTLSAGESGISATNVTINGAGSLAITESLNYGIYASDDIVIEDGDINIESEGSGIYTRHDSNADNANVTINGGTLNLVTSQEEGSAAILAGNTLTINNGTITVDSSYQAYVAKSIVVNGGTATLSATADGVYSQDPFYTEGAANETAITLNGGATTVVAGGNGLATSGSLAIAGGEYHFSSASPASNAIYYEGDFSLTGGTLIGLGAQGISQNFTSAEQLVLWVDVAGSVGDTITISDASGTQVYTTTASSSFSNMFVSIPDLVEGATYYVTTTSGAYAEATAIYQTGAVVTEPWGY